MSDSKIRQAFEYSNPFSTRHHTHKDFKKLTGAQRFGAVVVSMIVATVSLVASAIFLGTPALFLTTATCRALVGRFTQINMNAQKITGPNSPSSTNKPFQVKTSDPVKTLKKHTKNRIPEQESPFTRAPKGPSNFTALKKPSRQQNQFDRDLKLQTPPKKPIVPPSSNDSLAIVPYVAPQLKLATIVYGCALPPILKQVIPQQKPLFPLTNDLMNHLIEIRLLGSQPRLTRCIAEDNLTSIQTTEIAPTSFKAPINGFTIKFDIQDTFVSFKKDETNEDYFLNVSSTISFLNGTSQFKESFQVEKFYFETLQQMDQDDLLQELIKTSNDFKGSVDLQKLHSKDESLPTGEEIYQCIIETVEKEQKQERVLVPLETSSFNDSFISIPNNYLGESLLEGRKRLGLENSELNLLTALQPLFDQGDAVSHASYLSFENGTAAISEEFKKETMDTFFHLLGETYGESLSALVKDTLKLTSSTFTWKHAQATLISIAANVRAEDLQHLFNQLKGEEKNPPLRCHENILTTEQIEALKAYQNFNDLPTEMIDLLLLSFRSIKINGAQKLISDSISPIVRKNHQTNTLYFDPILHDMDLLNSLNSYQLTSIERIKEFPEVTRSEFCAKEITYKEVKKGMIISMPVLKDNSIASKHYQVRDVKYFADGIIFNLMTPLNDQQSLKDADKVDDVYLNFRGSGFSPDQIAAGATWYRNLDFWGIGKTTFDRYKKDVLSIVTDYLKVTDKEKINLNISGHSLAGVDVQRAVVALSKQIEKSAKISEGITAVEKYLKILEDGAHSHDEEVETPSNLLKASKALITLLDSQVNPSDPSQRTFISSNSVLNSFLTLRNEIVKIPETDVALLKEKMEALLNHEALTELKTLLPLWGKIETINVTSHNAPRPELALDDEFNAIFSELDKMPTAPQVQMTHLRFEDEEFEDIVQKLGDILIGSKINSTKLKNTILKVKIKHKFGKTGITNRHGFRAFCKSTDYPQSTVEMIDTQKEVNTILLNRHYWSDEEKGLITWSLANAGWYVGHIPRTVQNTAQFGLYYFGLIPIFKAIRAFTGSRADSLLN